MGTETSVMSETHTRATGKREVKAPTKLTYDVAEPNPRKRKATTKRAVKTDKKGKKSSKKQKKDPNAPKRPLSSYMLFNQAKRPQVKKDDPDMSFGEVGKAVGDMW